MVYKVLIRTAILRIGGSHCLPPLRSRLGRLNMPLFHNIPLLPIGQISIIDSSRQLRLALRVHYKVLILIWAGFPTLLGSARALFLPFEVGLEGCLPFPFSAIWMVDVVQVPVLLHCLFLFVYVHWGVFVWRKGQVFVVCLVWPLVWVVGRDVCGWFVHLVIGLLRVVRILLRRDHVAAMNELRLEILRLPQKLLVVIFFGLLRGVAIIVMICLLQLIQPLKPR